MEIEQATHLECPFCHGELIWGEDVVNDIQDTEPDNYADTISNYTCRNCGRYFEIFTPSQEDKEELFKDYWRIK